LPQTPVKTDEAAKHKEGAPQTPPRPVVDEYYSYAVQPEPVLFKQEVEEEQRPIKPDDSSDYIDALISEQPY